MELDKKNIVVVAGFQGINKYDDITTLGRGGSDTTAVAIAAALHADVCEIYTDVDGVYSADPRIVSGAVKLDEISYNINMEVKSSFEKVPGTVVKEEVDMEKMLVRGVARDNDVARISVVGVKDQPGVAFKIFSLLAKNKINVDIILQSIGRSDSKDISFTVTEGNLEKAMTILNDNIKSIGAQEISSSVNFSKVSVVGAGMVNNPGVASRMFEALFENSINIHMISTSEIKVSVLVDRADAERAVRAIHDKFDFTV